MAINVHSRLGRALLFWMLGAFVVACWAVILGVGFAIWRGLTS